MGYTHYWRRPAAFPLETWRLWCDDVRAIQAATINTLQPQNYGYSPDLVRLVLVRDDERLRSHPVVTDEIVSFNGRGKWGHEPFVVQRIYEPRSWDVPEDDGRYFEFCKTAQKPYDIVVCACLIRLAMRCAEGVDVSSDGDVEDWEPARRLCESLFGFAAVPFRA